mmetsp:Transcript_47206/g.119503  ORF Transcript_47206/g.119503 Transcript_47206/m.119503 type:complete len:293 (+) Transcript_47206:93-971(+)
MRAAVSKIKVPAAGARLAKLLRGVGQEPSPLAATNPIGGWRQSLDLRLAKELGFPGGYDYFHGDFLAGAMGALQHLAGDALPMERRRCQENTVSSSSMLGSDAGDFDSVVDAALRRTFQEGLRSLEDEGLELRWELEEISMASFGGALFVFGARRHPPSPPQEPLVRTSLGPHLLVAPVAEGFSSPLVCLQASALRGATLCVDAVLIAKQTVVLKRKADGEVIAATFDEAARHCLRLEADLATPRRGASQELSPADLWTGRPLFNEERGWLVSDLNSGLSGNCVAKALQKAE